MFGWHKLINKANIFNVNFYQSYSISTANSRQMQKSRQRIGSLLPPKGKIASLPRYNSLSLKKHNQPNRSKKERSIKPFDYLFTDSELLRKPKDRRGQKQPLKQLEYELENYLAPKFSKARQKSKQKSSSSKHKQQKCSKSKSKTSKSKEQKNIEKIKANRKKSSPIKSGSQKSKSTQRKKHHLANYFSNDNFSKTFKVTYQKEKSLKKAKSKHQQGIKWEQVLQNYGQYLAASEISEIRDIKRAYFLGHIKERKNKQLFSAKKKGTSNKKHHNCSEIHYQDEKEKLFYNQLLTERKQEKEKQKQQQTKYKLPEDDFYIYEIGDHIAYRYQIISSINKGAFGEVLKVFDHKNRQYLALKVIKKCPEIVPQTLVQISILTHIREKDKEELSGIVKIIDFTIFRKHICILFQLLESNLYELMVANNHNGLPQQLVRIFAIQILNSLSFLRKAAIIHCDLKPENIVMRKLDKSGIKIIDFGTSCFQGKQMYEYLQSRYYRAPQIMLGNSYSYPIDMWSFGCILAQLILGEPIFAGQSDIQQLMYIANSIGFPDEAKGPFSRHFLQTQQIKEIIQKRYIEEYRKFEKNSQTAASPLFCSFKYARNSMQAFQQRIKKRLNDQNTKLVDLLEKMLIWQPSKRINPQEALQDPWIVQGLPTKMKKQYNLINQMQKRQQKSKSKSKEKKQLNKLSKEKNKSKSKSTYKPKENRRFVKDAYSKNTDKYELKNTFIKAKLQGIIS